MRLLFSTVALAALVLASGCRNPTPSFNPYGAFGSPTVAPPPAGGYPASGAPGQQNPYYPGIQQPSGVTNPGAAPAYGQPASGYGYQSNNQTQAATAGGWQASNSNGPAAATALNGGAQTNTAVNRAETPNITNGTINDAGYGGAGSQSNNTTSSLLERIQRGRMPVHDATAPAGAAAPVPVPGYRAVPGYPAPVYPTAPAQRTYQVPPSMTYAPAQTQFRGSALTANATNSTAPAGNPPNPAEKSVLVASPSQNSTATNATPSSTGSGSSGDGLKWRSRHAPVLEVATR